MHVVMIADNPMDSTSWQKHECRSVNAFLYKHFQGKWPETARIYHKSVAVENDVTPDPHQRDSIKRLETFEEPLWVVVYPGTGVEIAIGIGVVALVASVAAVLLIPDVPSIKTPKERVSINGSPNNSLTDRSNKARPDQRIPDIFGLNRVIPDMLMVPYTQYENHQEVELGYYCIGRGFFDIQDARDGDTLISQIDNASCHVYNPGDAPTGPGPHTGTAFAVGASILDPVLNVYQIKAVNGQSLLPFNARTLYGATRLVDETGNDKKITGIFSTLTVYNFYDVMGFRFIDGVSGVVYVPFLKEPQYVHDRIEVGDKIFLRWDPANLPTTGNPKPDLRTDLDEPFANAMIVTSITDNGSFVELGVSIPVPLQTEWAKVPLYVSAAGADIRFNRHGAVSFDNPWAEVTTLAHLFDGPFFVDVVHPPGSSNPSVMVNFVAPNGLYAEDGKTVQKQEYVCSIGITPASVSGSPTGAEVFYSSTLVGSDLSSNIRALSLYQILPFNGRFLLRVQVSTKRLRTAELPDFVEKDNYGTDIAGKANQAYTGRIVDEIRMTQAYAFSEPPNISFGNVTTVHTRTINTPGATKVKDRELNLLAHRKINTWNGVSFGGLSTDSQAENIIFMLAKDTFIGNRLDSEIDFPGIAACFSTIRNYFTNSFSSDGDLSTRISITFDDYNVSFEELATSIANSAFATIYRQGNVLRCKPEIATDDAVVPFNHRNIRPGTQKITHSLGPPTENDSVEVSYVDPDDDSVTHVRIPLITSTVSPKEVRVTGLRSRKQAIWHAYRAYQHMKFQRQSLEMETTQEAGLCLIKDRVLIADITQLDSESGHVVQQSGLDLKLSQIPLLDGSKTYRIFLQNPNGTVESVGCVFGSGFFDLTLLGAPSFALITNPAVGVPTIYSIVADEEAGAFAYMISELTAQSSHVFNVSAVNYSNMYYFADSLEMYVIGDGLRDRSPAEFTLTPDHSMGTSTGPDGAQWLVGDGANQFVTVQTTDRSDKTRGYSLFCKAYHNPTPVFGYSGIIQTDDDATQLFGFFDNNIAAGHNNTLPLQFAAPTATLITMGVTWDPVSHRMALFLNGKVVASATVAAQTTDNFHHKYLKQYDGLAGNIIRYKRCLSDRAMMELHLRTKL
jgi:hypothetical protein